MENNRWLGMTVGIIGALLSLVGTFILFMKWYEPAQHFEALKAGCEILLKYVMPILADVAILAGLLYIGSVYGYFSRKSWAYPTIVIANILALQGSWFLNMPFMASGHPPVYFLIFWPSIILYFIIARVLGKVSWGCSLLGLGAAFGFLLCFMNGIASWNRILITGKPIFVFVQRMNWVSSIGWGVVAAGILIRPKDWMRVIGLGAGLLQLLVGIPLVIETTIELGRFSMFSIAPIICLILFILLLSPARFRRITGARDETAAV